MFFQVDESALVVRLFRNGFQWKARLLEGCAVIENQKRAERMFFSPNLEDFVLGIAGTPNVRRVYSVPVPPEE